MCPPMCEWHLTLKCPRFTHLVRRPPLERLALHASLSLLLLELWWDIPAVRIDRRFSRPPQGTTARHPPFDCLDRYTHRRLVIQLPRLANLGKLRRRKRNVH